MKCNAIALDLEKIRSETILEIEMGKVEVNKFVVCTAGTSIATNLGIEKGIVFEPSAWDEDNVDFEQTIKKKLQPYIHENMNNIERQRALSAEINTLAGLTIGKSDRVVLLASDTGQGRICSEAVRLCLIQWYELPENAVKVERVEGLQVNDQQRLEEFGLRNLVSKIISILDQNQYSYEIIFNTTGGYKGVVPFMAAIGMIFGKKIVYMFESSKSLLTLPPLPLSFNLTLYNRVRPALNYLYENSSASKWDYLSKIVGYTFEEENLFMSFVETIENEVTLSPLAFSLLEIEKNSQKPQVLESIATYLKNDNKVDSIRLRRMLDKVSNVLWRNSHYHSFSGTDLLVFKLPATTYRLAGYMRNNNIHITHAFSKHDVYERELNGARKSHYIDGDYTVWDTKTEDKAV